jgi:hypothetical protein
MWRHGARVVLLQLRIARCCAKPTIGQKEIVKKIEAERALVELSKNEEVISKMCKKKYLWKKTLNKFQITMTIL